VNIKWLRLVLQYAAKHTGSVFQLELSLVNWPAREAAMRICNLNLA